jgi:hypothetical protein
MYRWSAKSFARFCRDFVSNLPLLPRNIVRRWLGQPVLAFASAAERTVPFRGSRNLRNVLDR